MNKDEVRGIFAPTRESVSFSKSWGGYEFTEKEINHLLKGEQIKITRTDKTGRDYEVIGHLEKQAEAGQVSWAFKSTSSSQITGETAPFPKKWSGYEFTPADEEKLRKGEKIQIEAVSQRTGNPYKVEVTFELTEYNGKLDWRIKPHFQKRKAAHEYTRADAPFKAEFSGYTLTEEEIKSLREGKKVPITAISKKGKPFQCKVSLELKTFKERQFWGLEAHFEKRKEAHEYSRTDAPFKAEFSGYKLNDREIASVRAGYKIPIKAISKKGNPFTCYVSLQLKTYKGKQFWGLEAHFD